MRIILAFAFEAVDSGGLFCWYQVTSTRSAGVTLDRRFNAGEARGNLFLSRSDD